MGSLVTCCRHCSCPKQADTAKGRRQILNDNGVWVKSYSKYKDGNSRIKITTEYVERRNCELLFTRRFEPADPSQAKGMICYSLGFVDYTEWSEYDLGCKYAEMGFVVFMHDHQGHGRSDGDQICIDDFERDLVDEAIWVFDYAINKYIKTHPIYSKNIDAGNNYFLWGASMGGAIAIKIALKLQQNKAGNRYKGVVVLAPMVCIAQENMPPKWQIWCLQNCFLSCCPHARLVPNNLGETITNSADVQRKYEANPMNFGESIPLITGNNLLQATIDIERRTKELRTPMLMCHGDSDCVTDVSQSKRYFAECGCDAKDKEIKVYPGIGHMMLEEEPSVFQDTVNWMMKRMGIRPLQVNDVVEEQN